MNGAPSVLVRSTEELPPPPATAAASLPSVADPASLPSVAAEAYEVPVTEVSGGVDGDADEPPSPYSGAR